jgi:hypothetical protein
MVKNQNTWSHRTKIIFHHFGSLTCFSARVIVLWQALGLLTIHQCYTFIACWWGKYENLFTQEYHIPRGWINFIFHISCTRIKKKVKTQKKITGQKSYSTTSEASHVFPPELSFFDRHSERIICRQPLQCDFFVCFDFFFKSNWSIYGN